MPQRRAWEEVELVHVQKANVFLEESSYMADAIAHSKTKKRFDMPRIGEDYLFAVNESKRLIALYSRRDVRVLTLILRR